MHAIELTVRGFHCDMFAHVNNARYLEFLEEARWDWINHISSMKYFQEHDLSFIVVSITIHYRHPAVLNDVLKITVETSEIGNRSARVKQVVSRIADGKIIAEAEVTFALINNTTGKPTTINEELKAIFTR
jgi:thioesterase III